MYLLPNIPNPMISFIQSYQHPNTRPPESPLQMIRTSPRVPLTMNSSLTLLNLTPANLITMTASIHLQQSALWPQLCICYHTSPKFSSLSIAVIVCAAYTIASLVHCFNNGLSGRNFPMDINKIRSFFLSKPYNVVIKTLEDTTELGGFNQRLPTRKSNKSFPYRGPYQHKDDTTNTLFSSVRAHNGTTAVELLLAPRHLSRISMPKDPTQARTFTRSFKTSSTSVAFLLTSGPKMHKKSSWGVGASFSALME